MQDLNIEIIAPTRRFSTPSFPVIQSKSRKAQAASQDLTQSILNGLQFHYQTCRLFLRGDLKNHVIAWTLFGLAHALSTPLLGITSRNSIVSIVVRIPLAAIWVIANLLPCCIGNQKCPLSIQEDKINKPWRPLPSGRITPQEATKLWILTNIVACLLSYHIGGLPQCLTLMCLNYLYNDLGGANKSCISRNPLNGFAFVAFGMGSIEVLRAGDISNEYSVFTKQWLLMLVAVISTGIQVQDIYDVEGDSLIGRRTLPIVIGDTATRWTVVASTSCWSLICPWFFQLGVAGYVLPIAGAAWICTRTLTQRNPIADKKTYTLWNMWLLVIYCLPLAKTYSM